MNNALLQLMHDTAGPINRIEASVTLISDEKTSPEQIKQFLDIIKQSNKELRSVLDAYYEEHKQIL